jgi:uncharacterized protein YbjT (DUF2867 family)
MDGVTVHVLTRRPGAFEGLRVKEIPFLFTGTCDYEVLFENVPCDVLILTLGSTVKKGGRTGRLAVERDYPVRLIEAMKKANPAARVGYVSSVGADNPAGDYLKAKADVEEALAESGLASVVVRPSLLLAKRTEFRFAEEVLGKLFAPPYLFFARIFAPHCRRVWKYAPVRAEVVAKALLNATLTLRPGEHRVLEGLDILAAAKGATEVV